MAIYRKTRLAICIAGTLAMMLASAPAVGTAEEAFLARFMGDWSGGGTYLEGGMERPQRVTCRLEGQGGPAAFSMAGTCRAFIIISQPIAARVAYDPASGQFSGTYEGSRAGTARIEGQRDGDALHLSVLWPRPVHGDPRGRMTIINRGDDTLRIIVEHPYAPDAPPGVTIRSADLELTRQ